MVSSTTSSLSSLRAPSYRTIADSDQSKYLAICMFVFSEPRSPLQADHVAATQSGMPVGVLGPGRSLRCAFQSLRVLQDREDRTVGLILVDAVLDELLDLPPGTGPPVDGRRIVDDALALDVEGHG